MAVLGMYDCIVVGIGGHGSASLAYLAKSGQKVLGLEQFKPVHKHGSSHGRTRIYRQAYYEDPKYVPLLQRSLELFRELDDYYVSELREVPDHEGGIGRLDRLLEMSGAVMVGTPDSEVVSGVLRSIKEHKLPHKVYNAAQMRELYPTFHLSEDEVAVHEDSAGYLMAELCVESYIALARKHGAEVHFEEPMLEWKPCVLSADGGDGSGYDMDKDKEGVEVRTARGVYRAKKLVLSVGAWAPSIYGDAIPHIPLTIERRVLFWFQCDEDKITDFADMPIFGWEVDEGPFYGFPSEPALPGQVKVAFHTPAGAAHNRTAHPSQLLRSVLETEVEEMRAALALRIPGLNSKLLRTETCMYTCTSDGHFVLDFHPQHRNVLLVSPCSGHGFKFMAVVGEIVSELICKGKTKHDISLFSLASRTAPAPATTVATTAPESPQVMPS